MAAPHIPVDLVEEILSRVPIKSLLRFKTASKKWYSLLSQDHNFANLHLKNSKSSLLFFQVFHRKTTFQSFNIDTDESRIFNFPFEVEGGVELIGVANGLVCVAVSRNLDFFIWNPCTGECEKVYVYMIFPRRDTGVGILGFGYDPHLDDYKVAANWGIKLVRLFSLKTNSWQTCGFNMPKWNNAFQFNGALHWCCINDILAFDLVEEKVSFMKLPDEISAIMRRSLGFIIINFWEYQGCLCISGGKSIWMMKKYRDDKSWIKLSQCLAEYKKPLGISSIGEVVYRAKDEYGYIRSDNQGIMSDDDISQILAVPTPSAFAFTESLISPTFFNNLKS